MQRTRGEKHNEAPTGKPFEVIDLNDALGHIRPSNELLVTCRYIHTEARGIFVVAQRASWATNNFIIDLNDDLKSKLQTLAPQPSHASTSPASTAST
jgi:hypothetical protein